MALLFRSFSAKEIKNHGLDGKDLPKMLKILDWGDNETVDGKVKLTDKTKSVFDTYQKLHGREDCPIDFDHCSVKGSKEYVAGQPKAIAGYGKPKLVDGDGLYLEDIEWTPLGKKNARNYKDLSPAALLDDSGTVLGLDSVALTPTGAVKGLTFYSAKTFGEFKKYIETMSTDKETQKLQEEYDKMPGNEGIKELAAGDPPIEQIDHSVATYCLCNDCQAKNADGEHNEILHNLDSDDHYSKYGDVKYADPANHKYPIDTEKHIRAAWSYINMPKNSGKYSSKEISTIKGHIKSAMDKLGAKVEGETKTKTMSAEDMKVAMPQAFYGQPKYYETKNIMNEFTNTFKAMAAEVGMDGESDNEKVLFAFLAKLLGTRTEPSELINRKDNTEEGGLKQFSAEIEDLKKELNSVKESKAKEIQSFVENKKQTLVASALKDGKLVPFSADEIKNLDVSLIENVLTKLPKGMIPTARMHTMSSDGKPVQLTPSEKVNMFRKGVGLAS